MQTVSNGLYAWNQGHNEMKTDERTRRTPVEMIRNVEIQQITGSKSQYAGNWTRTSKTFSESI